VDGSEDWGVVGGCCVGAVEVVCAPAAVAHSTQVAARAMERSDPVIKLYLPRDEQLSNYGTAEVYAKSIKR
jgi:hypothetical protein